MRLTKTLREAFVRSAMNDVPEVEYGNQIRALLKKAAIEAMPAEVAKAYKKHPDWFTDDARNMPGFGYTYLPIPKDKELDIKAHAEVKRLVDFREAQQEQRRALRVKLAAAAESVNTRKALAELLPEFEKYLPSDEAAACKTLPAVANLVADFSKAGWPKKVAKEVKR